MPISPEKLDTRHKEFKERALKAAPLLYHYKWIAASIGIGESTLERYRKDDPDFEARLNQMRAVFIEKNMRKAKPEFLLQSADRPTFGEKKEIELSGGINIVEEIIQETGLREMIEHERVGNDERKGDGNIPVTLEEGT